MNKHYAVPPSDSASIGIEARFGLRVTALLNERASDHDIDERLRISRERALERARARRQTAPQAATAVLPQIVGVSASGAALAGRTPSDWWGRLASAVPILLLFAALVAIDTWQESLQVNAAADVDAALLTDDLPPEAYSDPGFAEFLRSPQE